MKKLITLLLIVLTSTAVFGIDFMGIPFLQPLELEYSSSPQEDGSLTRGMLRYSYNDSLSSWVRAEVTRQQSVSLFEGIEDSLYVSDSDDLLIDAFVLDYSGELPEGWLKWGVGAAFSYNRMKVEEQGNFYSGSYQVFGSVTTIVTMSPKIQGRIGLNLGAFRCSYRMNYDPVYFYSIDETMSISPMVAEDGVFSSEGTEFSTIDHSIRLFFFDVIELYARHQFQRFNYAQIGLSDTAPLEFVEVPTAFTTQSLTLMGKLLLPLMEDLSLVAGFGWNFDVLDNGTPGEEITSDHSVLEIGFSSDLW